MSHSASQNQDYYLNQEQRNPPVHVGMVLKFHASTHTATVALMSYISAGGTPLVMANLPVAVSYGGVGWGDFRYLRRGQLVQITMDNGSGLNAQIVKCLYTKNSEPPPRHPLLQQGKSPVLAWANQQPIGSDSIAGNLDYRGADGTRAEVILGAHLKENSGKQVERVSGPAVTHTDLALHKSAQFFRQAETTMKAVSQATKILADAGRTLAESQKQLAKLNSMAMPGSYGTPSPIPAIPGATVPAAPQVTPAQIGQATMQAKAMKAQARGAIQTAEMQVKNATTTAETLSQSVPELTKQASTATVTAATLLASGILKEVEATQTALAATLTDPTSQVS